MLEVTPRHLAAETDEIHENFSNGGLCPVRDLKPKTYEKKLLNWII